MLKRILVSTLLICSLPMMAQVTDDAIVMTIDDKDILLSEFLHVSQKNGEVDFADKDALYNYVDMFTNFKLKVADAEANGLSETSAFLREFTNYRTQLVRSYLADKNVEEAYLKEQYEKEGIVCEVSMILFGFPSMSLPKDTLNILEKTQQFCDRLVKDADFDRIGEETAGQTGTIPIRHTSRRSVFSMRMPNAVEQVVNTLDEGEISKPIRVDNGYYVVKLHKRKPNQGKVQVAHIVFGFDDEIEGSKAQAKAQAEEARGLARSGSDFAALVRTYSTDSVSVRNDGLLQFFGPGEIVFPFESAALALASPGDISDVVETTTAFHIIKLIERKERPVFEEDRSRLSRQLERSERSDAYATSFIERMKGECLHVYYPDVYAKLETLCEQYHPMEKSFFEKSREITEPLMKIDGTDVMAYEFIYYLQQYVRSSKELSTAYLKDAFQQFQKERLMRYAITNLGKTYPEYRFIVQEYRDGILLFEISNQKVWSKPAAEQPAAEEAWLEQLRKTYPVEVDWELLEAVKN